MLEGSFWLESVVWILLLGFFSGQIAKRLGAPPLVGMIAAGALIGPQVFNVLSASVLQAADGLRTFAVMVILMKAGLGLDREKLARQGTVALRLGCLPGVCEAIAVAFAAVWLLNFDFLTGLLLGCILAAESPAVIVPGMLQLKRLGWGSNKGIADAILTGSALSDVLLLLAFSLLLSFIVQTPTHITLPGGWLLSAAQWLPIQVVAQIALGAMIGSAAARLTGALLAKRKWTDSSLQDGLVAAAVALLLIVIAERLPLFSGYLAVMAMGFFLIEINAPLARRLRGAFNSLWVVAEIVLFVLLGASLQLDILGEIAATGLLVLLFGTLVGRSLGWILSTIGSDWTLSERLFLLPGNSAKATVQAAIGAIPLSMGLAGGEQILALSALSILITAPLGAWAIPTFAPRLLKRGPVDPTKIDVQRRALLLAAIDNSSTSTRVLTKAAEIARDTDSEIVVLYVMENDARIEPIRTRAKTLLADIIYRFVITEGIAADQIVQNALYFEATEIVIGKRSQTNSLEKGSELVGAVAKVVIGRSPVPVIVVDPSAS